MFVQQSKQIRHALAHRQRLALNVVVLIQVGAHDHTAKSSEHFLQRDVWQWLPVFKYRQTCTCIEHVALHAV